VQLGRALIVGPTARVELTRSDNAQIIEAELPAHRYRELNLSSGESLWVRPRRMRVFAQGE
jgi:sulfate transport system ATP-binding protein